MGFLYTVLYREVISLLAAAVVDRWPLKRGYNKSKYMYHLLGPKKSSHAL